MPAVAVRYPVPSASNALAPAAALLSGTHYFSDATTAVFSLVTGAHDWGVAAMRKANASEAPDAARDVPWLRLVAKEVAGMRANSWREVYRVNTAGGVPPVSCEGREGVVPVDYSAEYYFYA